MKNFKPFITLSFCILLTIGCATKKQQFRSIEHQGHERDYLLYLPKDLPENAPLVFVFHGYSSSAETIKNNFGFNKVADKYGFAVCYPQGLIDDKGYHFWQVGYTGHKNIKVDDVSYVTTLAKKLQHQYQLSEQNTFIVGNSNGGDFCNLLVCQTSGVFKAAAPIISCMMKEMFEACQTTAPTPLFFLNGTKDDITYWDGDMEDTQGYGPYLSSQKMYDFRITQNDGQLASKDTMVSPDSKDNTSINIQRYINDETKNRVWIYRVENGGHGHPDYLTIGEEIWGFFSIYLE